MQEAGTRIPCMRHGCGMAHVSTQPGTVVITFLYSANAGIVIPTWLGLGHRGTDLQRRGEPCSATQCTLAIRHAMHALCPALPSTLVLMEIAGHHLILSQTISNYLKVTLSAVESVSALLPRNHMWGAPSEATAPLKVSPLDMKLRRKISTGARHVTPAAPEQALARKCRMLFGTVGNLSGIFWSSRVLAVGFWTVRRLVPHATPMSAATASRRMGTRDRITRTGGV